MKELDFNNINYEDIEKICRDPYEETSIDHLLEDNSNIIDLGSKVLELTNGLCEQGFFGLRKGALDGSCKI